MTVRRLLFASLLVLQGCASMSPGSDFPKVASTAFRQPATTRLGAAFADEVARHPDTSAFRLLQVGIDGFVTRAQMIDAATRTLDVQYFILRSDETGSILTQALLRAADRGVRVRILVDDGETKPGDELIQLLDAHPRIEVRVFNPFRYRGHDKAMRAIEFAFDGSRLDYRMHNKLFVADDAVALIGGRNIADEYFQVDPEVQFADDDVFAAGPVVDQLSNKFDDFWNSAQAIPVAALGSGKPKPEALDAYRGLLAERAPSKLPDGSDYIGRIASGEPLAGMLDGRLPLVWAASKIVCDSPDKKAVEKGWRVGNLMQRPVADATAAVERELLMITPYLIPGQEGMQLLTGLRERDVTVRILTNSLESSTMAPAQAGYMHYRLPLIEHGVDLHEIRSLLGNARGSGQTAAISQFGTYSLHGKMFVFDRRRIFIGSMNFDQRSMHLNTEIGVIIDSDTLAQQVAKRFEAMIAPENAYHVVAQVGEAAPLKGLTWKTVEAGQAVAYGTEPAQSPWQRLQIDLLTLLPIDNEL